MEKKKSKIRFGIMCNGVNFKQWQADTIQALLAHKEIECSLLIVDKRDSSAGKIKNFIKKINSKNFLMYVFSHFSKKKSKAFKPVDMSPFLKDVPKIECQIIKKGKYSEYFKDSDIAEIKKYNLDFILRFGFGIIKGEILNVAKYGVWSFHHDDEQKYRGGPACFWEIYNKDKVTGAILQRLTEKLDAGIVLKKGFLKTNYSYGKNRDRMFFESSKWPAQVCVDILNGNVEYLNNEPTKTKAPIYRAPTNLQLINFFFKSNLHKIKNIFNIIHSDYWNIGIVNSPIHNFLEQDFRPKVKWYPLRSKDRFFADPFALQDGNKLHIFFEEYPYNEQKGKISYICYEDGKFSNPQVVINEPFHLSYPYLIEFNSDIYMVPESHEANKIILYKATDFPLKWKQEHILVNNFAGVDSTIIKYKGIWWMFTSHVKDNHYNLYLFYSNDLLGEWKPHPQNPVKTDVRSARSAGRPFIYKGELYRPSMDYSEKVEGSITINKIITLTKYVYKEVMHTKVWPIKNSYFSDKIHTLCNAGNYTLIDGAKEALIFSNINFLKHRMKRIKKKFTK